MQKLQFQAISYSGMEENSIDYMICTRIYSPVEITKFSRGSHKILSTAALTSCEWVLDLVGDAAVKDFRQETIG
jgi:hypothetical protein